MTLSSFPWRRESSKLGGQSVPFGNKASLDPGLRRNDGGLSDAIRWVHHDLSSHQLLNHLPGPGQRSPVVLHVSG